MAVPSLKYSIGNSASTTLATAMANSDTSATITSDTNFAAKSGEGMILVDEAQSTEEIAYSASKSGATLSTPLANRGLEGGSAQAHAINATVKGILTAGMWNDLIDSLLNVLDQTTGAVKTGIGLTSPKITTGINDANNNELLKVTATTSAVNELTLANAATGNNPILSATGGDDNIGMDFQAKGTGVYNFKSTASQATELRVFEDTDDGSNYVAIKPPALAANYTLTLPTTDGTASQYLQTDGAGALSWASSTSSISSKTGNTTRDISVTGDQTITGVGFTPRAIYLIAEITGVTGASWGFTDTSSADLVILQDHAGNMNVDVSTNIILNLYTGAGANAYAGVSAISSDGFTLTWAKNGSPTGTANIIYLCIA